MRERATQLSGPRWVAVDLTVADAPELQAFFDSNPLYAQLAYGRNWADDAAVHELTYEHPAQWPQGSTRRWALLDRRSGAWLGVLVFTEGLFATEVWHLGFLIVATAEHGSGLAREVHAAWVELARRSGAKWLRLGVIRDNPRGVAFWTSEGYLEVRQRHGLAYGDRVQSMSVRVRPLGPADLDRYLALVPRDRPESP